MERAPERDFGSDLVPKERYVSREFMALEWERMWKKVWLLAGLACDVREPGQYFTFEIGSESILVMRGRDGELRARYNVCMHRGNRLVEPGMGSAQRFTCQFHGWTYGTDGSLVQAVDPECFPQGLPAEKLDLQPVRCDTWGGFVFVSLAPQGETLAEYLENMPEHLDPYHFETMQPTHDHTVLVDCNWKTCVDAFNEAYHVNATHPSAMVFADDTDCPIDLYGRHSRMQFKIGVCSQRLPERGTITEEIRNMVMPSSGLDPESYQGKAGDELRTALAESKRKNFEPALGADFSVLNDDQMVDDFHYTLFPNVTFNIHVPTPWLFRHRPHPTDPQKMYFDFYIFVQNQNAEIPRPAHEDHVWGDGFGFSSVGLGAGIVDEDLYNLPRIQRGMASEAFPGLHLGTQEVRIRHFHDVLMGYLGGA
jgi:phenylpropionate dioxygenase-like ring-hydroxylating dioxygenase large terminal subunit